MKKLFLWISIVLLVFIICSMIFPHPYQLHVIIWGIPAFVFSISASLIFHIRDKTRRNDLLAFMRTTHLVDILASDFKDSSWANPDDCVIARAVKRYFNAKNIQEYINSVDVFDKEGYFTFKHEAYGESKFLEDEDRARLYKYSKDVTIRTLELIPSTRNC